MRTHLLRRLSAIALLVLLLGGTTSAIAQQPPSDSSSSAVSNASSSVSSTMATPESPEDCVEQIRERLRQQQRIWRGVLYGVHPAASLIEGSVRYDENGISWIKTGPNRWRTSAKGYEDEERRDRDINAQTEWTGMNELSPLGERESRLGIFERKGAITPQLVPEAVVAFRDFDCRIAMVCQGARATLDREEEDADGLLHVTTPGCEELVVEPLERCQFGDTYKKNDAEQIDLQIDETAPETQCTALGEQLVAREESFLRVAVSYDGAYRSLLQFAGSFDSFLRGLRGDLLGPIERLFPLLKLLTRASCFALQCNE